MQAAIPHVPKITPSGYERELEVGSQDLVVKTVCKDKYPVNWEVLYRNEANLQFREVERFARAGYIAAAFTLEASTQGISPKRKCAHCVWGGC